ncbi:hypothetical protein D6745_04470 [Candidatus Woesearchaeota archaeon]|nr:MAG: hypothetical protein D6745_04470 [Candidatus Woesearchaeota archaeon]
MINEKKLIEAFEKIKRDNDEIRKEIMLLKEENKRLSMEIKSLKRAPVNQPLFQKQIIKKINRHRKEIVKQKIIDILRTKNLSLIELKEIVVDKEQYCSKASFYRYVDELKDQIIINEQKVLSLREI